MGRQKTTLTEIFSYTTIGVSLALMSGLGLGHVTEQSMHPRLSANLPADPVERYALGQNAFAMPEVNIKMARAPSPQYGEVGHQTGRYVNGARVLMPAEPARKIDRLRLERLQAWNDENFGGDAGLDDRHADYAEFNIDDYAPIDVGAVQDAPESAAERAKRHSEANNSET
jgi:hypothetical protein